MEIAIAIPPDRVWLLLSDPAVVAPHAMPPCHAAMDAADRQDCER
jgi:hypothetical protein